MTKPQFTPEKSLKISNPRCIKKLNLDNIIFEDPKCFGVRKAKNEPIFKQIFKKWTFEILNQKLQPHEQ